MKRRYGWLTAVSLALALALAPASRAEPTAPPAASSGPQRPRIEELQRRLQELRQRVRGLPSAALPAPSSVPAEAVSAAPAGSAPGGRPALEELARRWAERLATRTERRARHRAELLREVGERASDPAVKAELELHAKHVADLARVEFLAQNARSGAQRDKLLARVAKLSAREAARHRAHLAKLLATLPAPSAAAPSAAAPSAAAPSAAAPSAAAPASSGSGAAR